MINYVGTRTPNGTIVEVDDGGTRKPLKHIVRHSPDGFEWGYGGSGPADLAHSILAHHLAVQSVAPALYQAFKFEVIGRLERDDFVMSSSLVTDWLGERWKNMSEEEIRSDFAA